MICPSCSHENAETAKFCSECAAKLRSICPSCGTSNPPAAKLCNECATPLASSASTTAGTPHAPAASAGGAASTQLGAASAATAPSSQKRLDLEHQFAAMSKSMPPTVRDQIMAPADGENRLVTELFTDMKSSVATTAGMEPAEAAELVNRLLMAMVDAFNRFEGRVDRFLGDGALAVFGTPFTHENDPERAILAAIEIREKANEIGLEVTSGINSGRVYFGEVGTEEYRELTVMGPVVNLAAHLQGQADGGEILIGETIQRHVRRAFELVRKEVQIKGISGAVPAFHVGRQLPRMQKARGLEGVTSELIGRESELAKLEEAYELTASGEGRFVCVIGEAGLEKSRLVSELRRSVEGALWLEGRCVELDVSPA